jgi:hypothetical protein
MSEYERLKRAQEMLEQMARDLGVRLEITQQVRRVDDGSLIVVPQVKLELVEGWEMPQR